MTSASLELRDVGRSFGSTRALADVDLEPEELLTRLDDVVTRLAAEEDRARQAHDRLAEATAAHASEIERIRSLPGDRASSCRAVTKPYAIAHAAQTSATTSP